MKFGIREVCNCHFEHLNGNRDFDIDTARMSTLDSTSTTVYAQGGRGFARLAAWEGEKIVTFTVEDALLTTQSLRALLGADFENGRIRIKSTSFAGYYKITADTLVRNVENGADEYCKITIYKAKLQSNINLSMAPNGDPSTFTFTFDAFPTKVGDDSDVIYDFAIGADPYNEVSAPVTKAIIYNKDGVKYTAALVGGSNLCYEVGGFISIDDGDAGVSQFYDEDNNVLGGVDTGLINSDTFTAYISGDEEYNIPLEIGSTTYWYVV